MLAPLTALLLLLLVIASAQAAKNNVVRGFIMPNTLEVTINEDNELVYTGTMIFAATDGIYFQRIDAVLDLITPNGINYDLTNASIAAATGLGLVGVNGTNIILPEFRRGDSSFLS
ncbi:MAG: hypothetical protein Q7R76_04015 [Candidatus Woesearchaeota archaeon]|nr:hypothetical protein [Candidatus Woesearchaeota archaeon]